MPSDNKLQEVIKTSLDSIRSMIDANTVIGSPIETKSGVTIIPVSKVAMGYATGGLDYNGKTAGLTQNFGAGGGTGLSIQPLGFLVISADGRVDMVNIGLKNPSDPVETLSDLLDRAPDLISKVKNLFGKKEPDVEPADGDAETVTE